MLSKKIEKALNAQINAELASSYLYLSMAAYFENETLRGFAHWMRVQSKEEYGHALRLYDHVIERGGKVALTALAAPKTDWKSALDAFKDTYAHEQLITGLINDLVTQAVAEKDYATNAMLQWFVTEQVEEEAQAFEIVQKLNMAGESKGALLVLDHHLAKRE